MQPQDWPKGFIYSPTTLSSDIHPSLIDHIFASKNPKDFDTVCSCIEEKRVHKDIQLRKITKNIEYKEENSHPLANKNHYGVFATKNISPHSVLGEYAGEYLTVKTLGKGVHDNFRKGTYSWHLIVNGCEVCLYSGTYANEITFINDYRGISDQPNTYSDWVIHRSKYHFMYISSRTILSGEEILVNYGPSWELSLLLSQMKVNIPLTSDGHLSLAPRNTF